MGYKWPTWIILVLALIKLAGCASNAGIPVINKSPNRQIPTERVVQAGESIYTISWQYGLDFLDIAKWNGIKSPYYLRSGQRLMLRPGAAPKAIPQSTPIVTKPLPVETPAKVAKVPQQPAIPPVPDVDPVSPPSNWQWPAKGKLIANYSRSDGVNGIRIAGQPGSAVRSTAAGNIVYVGEGLLGYGKLIIVKHSKKYLSAYAHNRRILVKEGQRVKASEQIAEMGDSGADKTMLHFEIRVNGKPEDPLKYLK